MEECWSAYVDDIDILALNYLSPIGLNRLPAPIVGKFKGVFLVQVARYLHNWFYTQLEKLGGPLPGVTVGFTHKATANNRNISCFQGFLSFQCEFP
jgi:hypothetical protein